MNPRVDLTKRPLAPDRLGTTLLLLPAEVFAGGTLLTNTLRSRFKSHRLIAPWRYNDCLERIAQCDLKTEGFFLIEQSQVQSKCAQR